jgi:pimeloyl-ACP methyl ester carboxylesterase
MAQKQEGENVVDVAVTPFGSLPLAPQLELLGIPTPVGVLTAFRAPAVGERRGTALFVPGFTGSKEDFQILLPRIAALGWDAVSYSQRGQADSAAPVGVEHYNLPHLAADAQLVAKHLGASAEPLHIVGHSLGGLVARAAAIANPALFADVTLLCSGPGGREGVHQTDAEYAAAHGLLALWERNHMGADPTDPAAPTGTTGATGLTDRDVFERDRFASSSLDNYLALTRILQNTADSTSALAATGLPALVAHGDADDAWPIDVQREMAERLGALYRVIHHAGHLPNIDNPDYTASVLADFWTDGALPLTS